MQKVNNHAKNHAGSGKKNTRHKQHVTHVKSHDNKQETKHITKAKQEKLKGCDL